MLPFTSVVSYLKFVSNSEILGLLSEIPHTSGLFEIFMLSSGTVV